MTIATITIGFTIPSLLLGIKSGAKADMVGLQISGVSANPAQRALNTANDSSYPL